ncbi:hypothetical protein ABZW03_18200 [Kitasatospora sp. NPDC004799]|uniref:hypothetical protein n=1 Tax=Kitasatospora sp. NPDC004799 TaxID=3154460 RepID=UPI0033A90ECD
MLAALPGTVRPTTALLEEEAARSGRPVTLTPVVVDGAWDRFEAGDRTGYLAAVATAVDAAADTDVVVLAQASMADAASRATTAVPVLSSPARGLHAAAHLAHPAPAPPDRA